MKKLVLMLCFIAGITTLSKAQGGGGPRRSPEEQAKQLQTQLKLSDDQTAKITSIMQMQNTKMDSIRTAGGDRQAMMPIRQAMAAKVKAVLTADQASAYDKMQAEMRTRQQNGGGYGGGNGGGTPPPPRK